MKITYFVHGTTTDNKKDLATGWLPGKLSFLGIQQSKELGQLVDVKQFSAIFCSDLKRAVDSATLAFGKKVIPDKRLREVNYGLWNGKSYHFKNHLERFIGQPFPQGESYRDVERRIKSYLEQTKQQFGNNNIAIVAHQAPQLALEVICHKKTWPQAIAEDWRTTGSWQPGWDYHY